MSAKKRLAVFAHWDGRAEVKRYIVHHVRALRRECDRVVFVSTAPLPEAELAKVAPYCAEATLRENVGFDFGMWQQALASTDLSAWDEVVLANSSVFGPLFPLGPILDAMGEASCDAWGMTDNAEIAWHLQSYFLVFKRSALSSGHVGRFFETVLPYRDKDQLIRAYEVGLSRYLIDQGLRLSAFAPLESLGVHVLPFHRHFRYLWQRRANPTVGYPMALLRAGMPYVKVELLRDNPLHVRVAAVRREMERLGYDPSLVEIDPKER